MDYKAEKHTDGVTTIAGQETLRDFARWSTMPSVILSSTELTANEKLVYMFVFTFNTNHRDMFGSNGFIASSVGLKQGTVANIISSLIKKKYLVGKYRDLTRRERLSIDIDWDRFHWRVKGVSLGNERGVSLESEHTNKDITNKVTKKETNDSFPKKDKRKNPEIMQILNKFNSEFGKHYTSAISWEKNFLHWRNEFTLEKILESIGKIKQHDWLGDKEVTPTMFFRTDKDWIEQCLAVTPFIKKTDYTGYFRDPLPKSLRGGGFKKGNLSIKLNQ